MPAFPNHNAINGIPNTGGPRAVESFTRTPRYAMPVFHLGGTARDAVGAPLPGALVHLFTAQLIWQATTVADAAGAYSFNVEGPPVSYWIVAYKAGAPDVAGATVNTLLGAA